MPPRKRKLSPKAQKTISSEVKKLVHEYEKTGKMHTTRATYKPKSKKAAIKQAVAIGYGTARKKGAKVPKRKSTRK